MHHDIVLTTVENPDISELPSGMRWAKLDLQNQPTEQAKYFECGSADDLFYARTRGNQVVTSR